MNESRESPVLGRFSVEDASLLFGLSKSVGWPTSLETWRLFLALPCGICFGHRASSGEAVSSAILFRYGASMAFLAMVIVRPDYRKRGLAGATIRRCLSCMESSVPVALIATEQGFPVYTKLGFRGIGAVQRFSRPRGTGTSVIGGGKYGIYPFEKNDFAALCELDAKIYGVARHDVLSAYVRQSTKCLVSRAAQGIIGFGMRTERSGLSTLGPVIASDMEAAEQLTAHLLATDMPVQMDINAEHSVLADRLTSWGFVAE